VIEKEQSIRLAKRILEHPNLDPDSDICVLARQLLRREERLQKIEKIARGGTL
jgi:hypothetical protein